MKLEAVSGITLTLVLLGMLTLTFNIQQAHSSEAPPIEWSRTYEGGGYSLVETSDRGYAWVSFTGDSWEGYVDSHLVKVDSSGNMQWNKTYRSTYGAVENVASSLVETSDGGYALAGHTGGFDWNSFWLVKVDSSGNMQWDQEYGEDEFDSASSLVETSDGGYALAGTSGNREGEDRFYLVKVDSSGNMQWNKVYGRTGGDCAECVVETSDGGYALAGSTRAFGVGDWDFWLVKTDAYGNMEWDATYGGTDYDRARAVVQTSDGGYALAGITDSFGAGGWDIWLVKTDSGGNVEWNQTYGGTAGDGATSIVQTSDGGYVLGGGGFANLVKTDSDGNLLWSKNYGDMGANSVVETSDGGYALGGVKDGDFWLIKTRAPALSPKPVISSVFFDKTNVDYGDWVTITVQARNDGGKAEEMHLSVSLPENPPVSNIQIVSHDLQEAYILPVGAEVWGDYGTNPHIILEYPLVQGSKENWETGETKTLQFKVKPENSGTFRFYVKATAQINGEVTYDPSSGTKDQQNEYVDVKTVYVQAPVLVGTLSGVVSYGGSLVEGAVVQAFRIDGSQHNVVTSWDKTSSTGEYVIEDLPTGTYEIIASGQEGLEIYTPRTEVDVEIKAGEEATVNFVFHGTMLRKRAPPWAVYTHTYDTPDGWFRVHYNSTGDVSSVVTEEYAEKVGDAFSHARIFETGSLFNYPEPTRDNGGTHDYEDLNRVAVYITQFLQGYSGIATVSETSSSIHCFAIGDFLPDVEIYATAYHEFFHGIQNNYFRGLLAEELVGRWVFEGTAAWMVFQAASRDPYLSQKGYRDLILGSSVLKYMAYAIEYTGTGSSNPPEKGLTSRDYDALYYWIFLSQKHGGNVVKDLLSKSQLAFLGSLDSVLREKYGSSFEESINEFFEKLYLRKTEEGKTFWGDDATKIFTDKELVAHKVTVAPSTSDTLRLTEAIPIGQYAAEYVEVYPRDGIQNVHLMFYGDILTDYSLEILGLKDGKVMFRAYPATNLFSESIMKIPQATSYDTLVLIIARSRVNLLGLGTYSLEIPKGVLTVSNHSPTRLLSVAPDGSKVGYDPELGDFVNEIPGSIYMNNTEPQMIAISDPVLGEYRVYVTGVHDGTYGLEVAIYSNGSCLETQSSDENIYSSSIHEYSLMLSPSSIEWVRITVTEDTIPPAILVLSPENETFYPENNITLTFTVDEPTDWMGYSLNGKANVTILGNTTLTDLSDGAYNIFVYANDTSGNMGASGPVHFMVDTTPPTMGYVSQTPPEDNVLPEDEVMVTAWVTDNLGGWPQATLNYTTNNGTWFTTPMTWSGGINWTATIPQFPYCTNVTYIVIAEDDAGNTVTSEELGYDTQYHVIPEFPSFLVLPLFMIATLLAAIVYRRKRARISRVC